MKYLNQLKNNKSVKTLASNFIYLSILRLLSYFFPLITLPYLARVIGPDAFGAIAFASSIMVIVETITDWGFNYTATRDVARNQENKALVSEIYSEVIYARTILTIICFICLYIAIQCIGTLKNNEALILFTFLIIPGNVLFPQWLFQAYEKMRYITILSLLSSGIFTGLIFIVIKNESDYLYQPLLLSIGTIITGIFAQIIIYRNFQLRLIRPNFKSIVERLKTSSSMFISLFLPNAYTNFSTIILKSYCGDFATGIYNGGQRLQTIIDQLTGILSRTFFPFLARNKDKHKYYVYLSAFIALCGCLFMYFGAHLFVKVFLTQEFKDAEIVMKIFALSPFFLFLMNTYGTNYLVIINKENILRNIIIFASILGFTLTWFLTPKYSFIGAAVTVNIIWGIRGFLTYYFARKEKKKLQSSL